MPIRVRVDQVMWCRQQSVNHQGLLCNLHWATTVVLSSWVERHILPLGHIVSWTSNHATYDVSSPKVVETVTHGLCYAYCFLYCAKNIFLSGFIKALDSKGILLWITQLWFSFTLCKECNQKPLLWPMVSLSKFSSAKCTQNENTAYSG